MINEDKLKEIVTEYLHEHYPFGKKKYKDPDKIAEEFIKYYNSLKNSDSDDNILELGAIEYNTVLKQLCREYIEESNKKYQKNNLLER